MKTFIASFLVGASVMGATYLVSNYTSVTVEPTPVIIIDQRDKPPTEQELQQRYGRAADLKHPAF